MLDHFDLLAGSSTGSLIALLLALGKALLIPSGSVVNRLDTLAGYSPAEIVDIYKACAPRVNSNSEEGRKKMIMMMLKNKGAERI